MIRTRVSPGVIVFQYLSEMGHADVSSPETDELEAKLAGFVRSYIRSDPTQREEALRWVCAGL